MAQVIYFSTKGAESPTKAAFPFLGAAGAISAGHQPQIILFGDAVSIMKNEVACSVFPKGWPPLNELIASVVEQNVPILVCGGCSTARGVTQADLDGKNAKFTSPKEVARIVATSPNVISN